jgi:hypothetical protein
LAAAIPAIRATSSGFPFGFFSRFTARTRRGFIFTNPCATAVRVVTAFSDTSTIRTSPFFP